MNSKLSLVRLCLETLGIVIVAEALVVGLLALLGLGSSSWRDALWHAALLATLTGPLVLWRCAAAAHRAEPSAQGLEGRAIGAPLALTAIVLTLGLAATLSAAHWQQHTIQSAAEARFARQKERLEVEVQRRFLQPVYGLMGARGVYAASVHVDRAAWRAYVRARDLPSEFPGVRGFGFTEPVRRADLAPFVAGQRLDGQPDFEVRTSGSEPLLYVIKYIEPLADNREALGLDVGAEPVRRQAIERAIRTGRPTLSAPISLVQDAGQRPGFLYMLPVYRQGVVPGAPQEREAALLGVAYAPIVVAELLAGAAASIGGQLNFELFDGSETTDKLVFSSGGTTSPALADRLAWGPVLQSMSALGAMEIGGRQLWLRVIPSAAFLDDTDRWSPSLLRVGGSFVTLLLALTVWLLATGQARARALAQRMTTDLARMAEVVRHTSNAVVITDRERNIAWVNAGFTRLYGYSPEEAAGTNPARLLGSGRTDAETLKAIDDADADAAGQGCRVEVLNRAKDGRDHWIDLEIQPRRDSQGKLIGFMEIGQDITDKKLASLQLAQALDALTREQRRLDQILEGTHVGTWEWNVQAGSLQCNERWAGMAGYALEQLSPLTIERWRALCHPDDVRRAADLLLSHLRGQLAYFDCELRMRHREGHWIWILLRGRISARTARGRPQWMAGTQMDITERKRAEEQLRASKAFLERAERVAGVGGWEVDLRSNTLTWSEQTFRIYDVKPGQQPALEAAFEHFAPREREFIERTARDCIQHRQPWDLELPLTTADGRAIWIRSVGAVEIEADRPIRLVGTIQDITPARRMREELRRSNAVLRSILDNLPCGLSVFDGDLRLAAHNAAYRELLDLPHDLVEGPAASFEAIIRHNAARGDYGPGQVDDIVARLVAHAREPIHMRSERQTHDGKSLEVRSAPMPGGGFVTTYMDVTERKNMERLKSEFISTVTHELRTPLTSIYGSLSLLASGAAGPLPEAVQELVARSFQSSERLVRLINDVLDVERIEARRMNYAMSQQLLAPLVEQAIDATRAYADQHGVRLEFESRIDSICVLADPDRIVQVVINLLSNAVKFSGKERRVLVRMAELGEQVRVCVIDDGPGIPEAFRPRIFERFSQADSSDRRQKGGTGLGLNICRSVVAEHGGQIDYDSVPGQGTRFHFDLPIAARR